MSVRLDPWVSGAAVDEVTRKAILSGSEGRLLLWQSIAARRTNQVSRIYLLLVSLVDAIISHVQC